MNTSDIGLIGMGVMGENLALNFERRGCTVSIYNRIEPNKSNKVELFMQHKGAGKRFIPTDSIAALVDSVRAPRKIMLMVSAGVAVDDLIHQLVRYLSPGDVIIDGGNSDYRDTAKRMLLLESKGFYYIGAGVSGGEMGALHGPSIMPGGSVEAWPMVEDLLKAIAAKLPDGSPCCEWMGAGGAGHFVKMVHNGIEYAFMQLIAEAAQLLKSTEHLSNDSLSRLFYYWNEGDLKSYLIKITAEIFAKKEDNEYLIDQIRDTAGQKGTGSWSVQAALDLGEPLPIISQALFARYLSSKKELRFTACGLYAPCAGRKEKLHTLGADAIQKSLYAAVLMAYSEGFSLLWKASVRFGWGLDLETIARIWQKGCIIRAAFLEKIVESFKEQPNKESLLLTPFYQEALHSRLPCWRNVLVQALEADVSLPCMSAALTYLSGLSTYRSTANLIQAQRDYFGAHTYERVDKPAGKFYHTNWEEDK